MHHFGLQSLLVGKKEERILQPAAAKSLQSCPTLWDPRDGSPPGSPVPGILQARTLEWAAIAFSNAWKWKGSRSVVSGLLATPWTAAYQAPPPVGLSRQEYWSGVPLLSPMLQPRWSEKQTACWNHKQGAFFSDTHSLKCVHTNKYLMTNSNTRGDEVLLKTKTPPNDI